MTDNSYEKLAEALDRLPNGFPRTTSNVEILLLKRIFSPEEAFLAGHLTRRMEEIAVIAERAGLPEKETRLGLKKMSRRGLLWIDRRDGSLLFRLAPFVVGIFEAQLLNMDRELSDLIEKYLADGGAAGIMKPQPALHRVVPAQGSVNGEWVMPYDDVRAILLAAKSYSVRDCICRVQRKHLGHTCDHPMRVCLMFNMRTGVPGNDDISQAEALAILDKAEESSLVHTVSNVTEGIGYVCNCCGCCCAILRGINEWGIEKSVAYANYYAEIDPDLCQNCGTCIERCQVKAISAGDDVSVVERAKCIGCGLCVTGCPDDAVQLFRKPEEEIIHPPADYPAWEHERLRDRGMAD